MGEVIDAEGLGAFGDDVTGLGFGGGDGAIEGRDDFGQIEGGLGGGELGAGGVDVGGVFAAGVAIEFALGVFFFGDGHVQFCAGLVHQEDAGLACKPVVVGDEVGEVELAVEDGQVEVCFAAQVVFGSVVAEVFDPFEEL